MIFSKVRKLALSRAGRAFTALFGFIIILFILKCSGWHAIYLVLTRSLVYFPLILLLEAGIIACSMCALRLLYQEDRKKIPLAALLRSGLIGYAAMGLLPAGRAFAESTRAVLLSRYSTGPQAAAAATHLQGLALLANAAISLPATACTYYILGYSLPTLLIFGNFILTLSLGLAIFLGTQRSQIGNRLGKIIPQVQSFGRQLDQYLLSPKNVALCGAFCWEFVGRLIQVLQNCILVIAVGGKYGLARAFCSEALHLVGAAAGDLIPAQLGATEFNYQFSAHLLQLQPSDAVSIALIAHLAQLFWVLIGLIVPIFWTEQGKQQTRGFVPNTCSEC